MAGNEECLMDRTGETCWVAVSSVPSEHSVENIIQLATSHRTAQSSRGQSTTFEHFEEFTQGTTANDITDGFHPFLVDHSDLFVMSLDIILYQELSLDNRMYSRRFKFDNCKGSAFTQTVGCVTRTSSQFHKHLHSPRITLTILISIYLEIIFEDSIVSTCDRLRTSPSVNVEVVPVSYGYVPKLLNRLVNESFSVPSMELSTHKQSTIHPSMRKHCSEYHKRNQIEIHKKETFRNLQRSLKISSFHHRMGHIEAEEIENNFNRNNEKCEIPRTTKRPTYTKLL